MRYLILSVVIFSLLGCKENAQIKRLEAQNAQLVSEYQRISTDIDRTQRFMDESAETLNQVYENLETVSKREGIIAQISRDADGTATGSVKNEIMGNIKAIDRELQRSKRSLNSLQSKLNAEGLEFESMQALIDTLKIQIEAREKEAIAIIEEINLKKARYADVQETYTARKQVYDAQKKQLNVGYYIIDTKKSLKQLDIIEEKGGFLGINKVAKLKPEFNKSAFNEIDIESTDVIEIQHEMKKVKIISPHPQDSYQLIEGTNKDTFLEIMDPDEFWKIRYLVIQH